MRITTLGPLAVDGQPVRGTRLAAAVRELVGARGRAVSTAALTRAVWTDEPPEDAPGALQALVSRVRRLGVPVLGVPGGYRVLADEVVVDAVEAKGLAQRARQALRERDAAAARRWADQARSLFPEVPDLADPDAARLFAEVTGVRAEAALAGAGAFEEADLRRLAEREPPDEPAVALLVRGLAAQGREAEALAVVERLRAELADRYGTDPSPIVVRAQLALLRGELGTGHEPESALAPSGPPTLVADGLPAGWRRAATPLLGREPDVLALIDALAEAPLVTVVATGGAGKTRLAAEVARRAVGAGRSVRVVELAGLRSADEVLPALLAAIGGTEPSVRTELDRRPLSLPDRLRVSARDLTGLVVLDNCEHLLDATATIVADLLAAAPPELAVLATSRAPLGLIGESVYRLAALSDVDAVRLIEERGRAGGATPAWPADRLLELVHRLDNLPLALELAAARLRQLPIEEVLDGLANRFALLDDALRGLPERHAGLWALVDWSRELLDPPERELLQRLAVIPAPFTAAGAAAVAGGGVAAAGVARGLGHLVEQSLLTFDGPERGQPRYRMLETVREYGEARLDAAGDRAAAMTGLVEWARTHAISVSAGFIGPGQADAFDRCAADQENLVAALRWAINHNDDRAAVDIAAALFHLWTVRGLHVEALEWGRALLHVDEPAPAGSAIRYPASAGKPLPHADRLAWICLLLELSSGLIAGTPTRLHALARRTVRRLLRDRPAEISERATVLASAVPGLSSSDPAVSAAATVPLIEHPDPYVQGFGLFAQAVAQENSGRLDRAAAATEQAYYRFEAVGDHWLMGLAAQGIAQSLATRGRDGAGEWLRRGARHFELVGATQDARSVQVHLDIELALAGDAQARQRLHDTVTPRPGDPAQDAADVAQARFGLAQLAWRDGRYDEVAGQAAAMAEIVAETTMPIPQQRVVFRVIAAVLRLRAAAVAPDTDRDGDVDPRAAALLRLAWADAITAADIPVLGSWGMGGAELANHRGEAESARELCAIGVRLGAHLMSLFQETYTAPGSLTLAESEPLTALWWDRSVIEASSRIEELMRELLGPL